MLADAIPDSSIKWIEGAAHWVTDEQPESVPESLEALLYFHQRTSGG